MPTRRTFLKHSAALAALPAALPVVLQSVANAEENPSQTVTLPKRNEVASGDTWDLTPLFKNDEEWKTALEETRKRLPEFKEFEGKLLESIIDPTTSPPIPAGSAPRAIHAPNISVIENCFALEDSIGLEVERLTIYAYLRSSEDVANPLAQEMQSLVTALQGQFREATSFIRPELLALDETMLKLFLNVFPPPKYSLKLIRIFRQKPHVLSKDGEQMLAQMTEVSQTASKAFGLLNDADLKFGNVTDETGKSVQLSTGSFVVLMNSPDRKVRETAFNQFYAGYQSVENTLASLLGSSIQKDVFNAKVRNFPSSLESALFYPEIPRTVYDNLLSTVNKALPVLYRYYDIRRRAMGIDTIHMYDTYIPILSDIQTNYPWDKGAAVIAESLRPMGEEYVKVMTEGLTTGRWCDRYENEGKRSGAFCYGSFTTHPYIMMNYKDTVLNSLFTLTHEGGHAMHSFYSARTQPFTYWRYVTFVAEVASTFNEDMLSRYLMAQTNDKNMKAYLVNRQIDAIRQTLFRQTMFAEFEQRTHAMAEAGQPLTAKSLKATYRQLLDTYFGPRFTIDEALERECFRVPHFYRAFYVYQYATGISAALSLAERVSSGGEKERDDYIRFLSGGSSASPIELLRIAGIDMESPAPIEAAMKRFEQLVGELEELI